MGGGITVVKVSKISILAKIWQKKFKNHDFHRGLVTLLKKSVQN